MNRGLSLAVNGFSQSFHGRARPLGCQPTAKVAKATHDVLTGLLPAISSNTSPQLGHFMMCDASRISSAGWILYRHKGHGRSTFGLGVLTRLRFGRATNERGMGAPCLSVRALQP
jgi:hypothetical protein